MNKTLKGLLLWTPRLLSILLIAFLALFSLDVFGTGAGFWATLAGFLIHNLPAIALIILLILAWRWEWVGALAFLGFGTWYLVAVRGQDVIAYLLLAGVPMLIGVLFLLGWVWRKKIRA
jgi:hypothetical protein